MRDPVNTNELPISELHDYDMRHEWRRKKKDMCEKVSNLYITDEERSVKIKLKE